MNVEMNQQIERPIVQSLLIPNTKAQMEIYQRIIVDISHRFQAFSLISIEVVYKLPLTPS